MKNKHRVIPAVLLIYLMTLSHISYDSYASGEFSAFRYFGTIAVTFIVIVILFFSIRRRERLRKEREDDIKRNDK